MTAEALFAPAKINLCLHVTGRTTAGYHLLDSLVVFADAGDRITLHPGPALSLRVTGPFAEKVPEDARNLVWRAAEAAGWTGAMELHKALPNGAGIGGGSSDAAAVLTALGAPEQALSLGADVPVCLRPVPQIMRGIGEDVQPVPGVPPLDLVLVNPGVPLSTPAVFGALAQRENAPMAPLPTHGGRAAFVDWLCAQRNDLQAPARALCPEVGQALAALEGAALVRMSGSGTTCWGLFDDAVAAREAAARLNQQHPGWWVRAVRTGGS